MNLTQTPIDAKQASLNQQAEQMLKTYNVADKTERKAVVSQINAFLPIVSKDEKVFWLNFLCRLKKIDEKPQVLFELGQIFLTPGAQEVLAESNQHPIIFLSRHQSGDFGEVCEDDKRENEISIKEGFRILSAYRTSLGVKLWIITEADRSSSCLLLPEEY
jgi:hypothetical protein